MKKFLRAFKTQAEYLAFTASTEFILDNVSSCREGDLVYFNSEQCGGQGMHRTISGETYCDGYDKRLYLYKQVSYDGGVTWETTATTSSLVERNSEDCGYVPPSYYDITAKFNVTDTSSPTRIVYNTTGFSKIEVDDVEQPSVTTGYTFDTLGENTVKYKLNGTSIGSSALFSCTNITNVVISDKVTHIGDMAFTNCSGITSVTIPNSVTRIGNGVFQSCTSLTSIGPVGSGASVEIPNSLRSLNADTFSRCTSLTSVTIPDSIITVAGFSYCDNLTSCTIGSGVTTIFDYAFEEDSSLTSINIPSGVTSIGREAFDNCTSLTSVTVNAVTPPTLGTNAFNNTNNCPIYVPCDSVDTYKSASVWSSYASRIQAIPGSCPLVLTAKFNVTDTSNPTQIASGTSGFSKIIIDGIEQQSVTSEYTFSSTGEHTVKYYLTNTSIGNKAFYYCRSLTSVVIPSGVRSIGSYAFDICSSLTSIDIPSGVTYIGDSAFYGCSGLTSIDIPSGVTSIGAQAFGSCYGFTSIGSIGSGASVEIPDGVTSIEEYTFVWCSGLTSVDIPSSITSVNNNAFYGCRSLASITVDSNNQIYDSRNNCNAIIKSNNNELIIGCKNTVIPNSVTSIGDNAFDICYGLTSIDIPDSVTSIGNNAFYSCSGLTSCTIGSGVTTIGGNAFQACRSLTSVVIPSGVTSIGNSAFLYCTSLTSVTVNAVTPPTLGATVFDNTNNCPIYVPCDSVDAYKAATNWSNYTSRIQAILGSC